MSSADTPYRVPLGAFRRCALWVAVVTAAILGVACYPGTYPFDLFAEMHYQPSQRRLEPDRLSPPAGSVPITGAAPSLTFEEAGTLQNLVPRGPEQRAQARGIFQVNCAMCHGQDGRGQSFVAERFAASSAAPVPPVDFTSQRVRTRADGQLYWIVTNGLGNMPPFHSLLADEERWLLVHLIREMQGQ